jgi:hypothetical protein
LGAGACKVKARISGAYWNPTRGSRNASRRYLIFLKEEEYFVSRLLFRYNLGELTAYGF